MRIVDQINKIKLGSNTQQNLGGTINNQPQTNILNILSNNERMTNLSVATDGHPGAKINMKTKALNDSLNMGIRNEEWSLLRDKLAKITDNINGHIDSMSNNGQIVGPHDYKPETLLYAFGSDGMSELNKSVKNAGEQISSKVVGGYSFMDIMSELFGKILTTPEFINMLQPMLMQMVQSPNMNKYGVNPNMVNAIISELNNVNHVKESLNNMATLIDYTDVECKLVAHMNESAKTLSNALPSFVTSVTEDALRSSSVEEITANMIDKAKRLNILSNEFCDVLADRLGTKFNISLDPIRLNNARNMNTVTVEGTGGFVGIRSNPAPVNQLDQSLNFGAQAGQPVNDYFAGGMRTLPNGNVMPVKNTMKQQVASKQVKISDIPDNMAQPTQAVWNQPVTQPSVWGQSMFNQAWNQPVTQPSVWDQPVTQPVAPAWNQPVTQPVMQPVAPAWNQPVTQPVMQPVAPAWNQPVTQPGFNQAWGQQPVEETTPYIFY